MSIVELKVHGCRAEMVAEADTNKPRIQESLAAGVLKGYCPFIEEWVTFNVDSLFGHPTRAICEKTSCQHHTKP